MEIIKTKELNRGYKVILLKAEDTGRVGDSIKFDVDVRDRNDATIYVAHSGCYGIKSGNYWMDETVKYMQRLLLLIEDREMAYHNQLCYSKTYAMDTPKEGCEDKWEYEKEKTSMIENWLTDLSEYYGKDSERTHLIRLEFDIHE